MKGINQAELEKKLDLVIQKLMNLGGPEDEKELEAGGEKIGFFRRDFGIKEWDWPQGRSLRAVKDYEGKEQSGVPGFPVSLV